jgi:predicted transcriptional regulator
MEILLDILEAVTEGRRKPTHIMYRANLSWTRLTKNLDFLVKQDLLEKSEVGGTTYRITQRGKDVLEYSNKIKNEVYPRKRTFPTEVYIRNT